MGPNKWEGGLKGVDRSHMRKNIISKLGSNRFTIKKYNYKPDGWGVNYVVIFKVERGAMINDNIVQACQNNVLNRAPQYWLTQ